jgi:hypothetical protein
MLAKKKGKKRKPTPAKPSVPRPESTMPTAPPPVAAAPTESPSTFASPPAAATPGAPIDERLDDVLRRAGISSTDSSTLNSAPSGPTDPLSKIPKAGQELLERFFGGGALVFGSAFLLSGIAVAIEAICKVTGNPLPPTIDEALVQYVEPALTPSLLILFGFSISLGLLKQLQLGFEGSGVLYQEDDE